MYRFLPLLQFDSPKTKHFFRKLLPPDALTLILFIRKILLPKDNSNFRITIIIKIGYMNVIGYGILFFMTAFPFFFDLLD